MYIKALASGSNGNCISVGDEETHILIDAGISCRRIVTGLSEEGRKPEDISAVFISHEHADHIVGLLVFAGKYHLPVYATEGTLRAIRDKDRDAHLAQSDLIPVTADKEITVGSLTVRPFSVTHDAADPVAYRVESGAKAAAVCTDLGNYTDYTVENLTGLNALLLEANHDIRMLQAGPYPFPLKRRILSDYGHLCNEASGQLLARIWHPSLRQVLLGHISQENNLPELARLAVCNEIDAADIPVTSSELSITAIPHGASSALLSF